MVTFSKKSPKLKQVKLKPHIEESKSKNRSVSTQKRLNSQQSAGSQSKSSLQQASPKFTKVEQILKSNRLSFNCHSPPKNPEAKESQNNINEDRRNKRLSHLKESPS